MVFNVVHWNVDPEIFRIGKFAVRWYGLLFASGFLFGYMIMAKMFRKEGVPLEILDKLTLYVAVGTVVGARLGHVCFYEPSYFCAHPGEILKIWHGGLASHGAAIGILLALWLFKKKTGYSFLWTIDRVVVVVALAGFFIRMGNLMNSEIYGVPTSLPWGFIFERNHETVPKHPTQIYEALSYLLIFFYLRWVYYRRDGKVPEGLLFSLFLILIFTARFFIEFIKEPQEAFEQALPLDMGQILSIPFILAGVALLIYVRKKEGKS